VFDERDVGRAAAALLKAAGARVLSRFGPNNLGGWIWSSDSTRLAGQGGEGRTLDIYQFSLEGSSEPRPVFRSDRPKYASSWTRDGRSSVLMQFNEPKSRDDSG
jgi:hypothetical protein